MPLVAPVLFSVEPEGNKIVTDPPLTLVTATMLPELANDPPAALLAPGETTVADVSDRLGVSRSTVTSWIGAGLLTARRAAGRYLVAFTPEAEAACRQRIAASAQIHQQTDTSPPAPGELSPAAVAARLGISRDAVYNWVSCGHLPARHGAGGRLHIRFTPEIEAA